jgi:anti-sigma regulatory factor (Ser/Thr protein kinase)
MNSVPLISTDTGLFDAVGKLMSSAEATEFTGVVLKDPAQALDFLTMEMPELVFIDFSDKAFDAMAMLETIMADQWLFHGGIIALCGEYEDASRLEEVRGANIVVVILREDLEANLPRTMDIVRNNRRILFQRELGADLVWNISGSFKLENDPIVASCYANLIANFLCNSNRIDRQEKPGLTMAIYEMVLNAIEHGNCGITYEEKSEWLEKGSPMNELIRRRCAEPRVAAKRVTFEYSFGSDCAHFFIADEGAGFDWRKFMDGKKQTPLLELHGRGITLTRNCMMNLRYNDRGNEVSFDIAYQKDAAAATPDLFRSIGSTAVGEGQIIFQDGEPGDFLYYIVKGQYEVLVRGTPVSVLSPDDVFMGEMSFLLNNRRSATVRAKTEGSLIKVSRQDFVKAIRRKPHYALFLSRLLAQRLFRQNERTVSL